MDTILALLLLQPAWQLRWSPPAGRPSSGPSSRRSPGLRGCRTAGSPRGTPSGALTWGTTSVVLGALAGRSYAEVQTWLGGAGAALLVGTVAAVTLVAFHRRRAAAAVPEPVVDVVLTA